MDWSLFTLSLWQHALCHNAMMRHVWNYVSLQISTKQISWLHSFAYQVTSFHRPTFPATTINVSPNGTHSLPENDQHKHHRSAFLGVIWVDYWSLVRRRASAMKTWVEFFISRRSLQRKHTEPVKNMGFSDCVQVSTCEMFGLYQAYSQTRAQLYPDTTQQKILSRAVELTRPYKTQPYFSPKHL
jgi:hypothetical protein